MSAPKNPSLESTAKIPRAKKLDPSEEGPSENLLALYAPMIGIGIGLVIIGIVAYFGYASYSEKKWEKSQAKIYQFRAGPFKLFEDKKIKEEELIQEWTKLGTDVGDDKSYAVLTLEMARALMKEGKSAEVVKILGPTLENFRKDSYLYYFLGTYLSAAQEDSGNRKEAIAILEEILKRDAKFLEPKLYFDLGRLYHQEGNKEKAKLNFQYVVDNFPDDKMSQLARIFMKKL